MKQFLILGIIAGFLVSLGCDQPSQIPDKAKAPSSPAPSTPVATASGGPPIGEIAPEIVGVDLDGVEFKLSDYRGQVIMLDFYGDW